MSQKPDLPEKVRLIELVRGWRDRAKLRHLEIVNLLHDKFNCVMAVEEFEHCFTTHPKHMARLTDDQIISVISLFATFPPIPQRCTAHEAIEVAKLAKLSLAHYAQLAPKFPPTEFRQACSQLLGFDVSIPPTDEPEYPLPEILMPPPRRLFGVEKPLSQLRELLSHTDEPHLILIAGLGGLGKTTLASELSRPLPAPFEQLAWVTAQQQILVPGSGLHALKTPPLTPAKLVDHLLTQLRSPAPAFMSFNDKLVYLQRELRQYPYLVVIDNLETLIDYQTLLPTLEKLTRPTKFILTCREFVPYPTMFALSLDALSQADSFALLKYRATLTNVPRLLAATPDDLAEIYDTVGGNPLALELVVGQLNLFDLPEIIAHLREARGETLMLYRYIYQSSWGQLSEQAKLLLQGILFSPHCSLTQWRNGLAKACGLDEAELYEAINQLKRLSLIQINTTDHNDYRYSLHRLTETFLITEVVNNLPSW